MKTSLKKERAYLKENSEKLSLEDETFIAQSNKSFNLKYPFSKMKNKIIKEKEGFFTYVFKNYVFQRKIYIPVLASMLVVIFLPLFNFLGGNETTRLKGSETGLHIYKKDGTGFVSLKDNSVVHEGDVLQLSYFVNEEFKYGAIISVDGNEKLTLHFPEKIDSDSRLINEKNVILSNSFELDNAPKFEKFYFVLSKNRIDVKNILEFISNTSRANYGTSGFNNLYVNIVTLRKEK